MRLNRTPLGAAKALHPGLLGALVFCAIVTGCDNFCLVIQSNPGGTIDTNATCQPKTGNIGVTFSSSIVDSGSLPVRAPRIFLTLRGIDALGAPGPGADAATWQELAPQLADKPMQVELTAHAPKSCATGPLGSAAVPAGVYRQLRLRFIPNAGPGQPDTPILEQSGCGAKLFNCLIPPDTAPEPLAFENSADLVIPSNNIADGFIRVTPDNSVRVSIAFDPVSSRALLVGTALRLVPTFSVSTDPCPSGF
jgi:hypothetical protein